MLESNVTLCLPYGIVVSACTPESASDCVRQKGAEQLKTCLCTCECLAASRSAEGNGRQAEATAASEIGSKQCRGRLAILSPTRPCESVVCTGGQQAYANFLPLTSRRAIAGNARRSTGAGPLRFFASVGTLMSTSLSSVPRTLRRCPPLAFYTHTQVIN